MEQISGSFARNEIEDLSEWSTEHVSATGWESRVLDQVRITVCMRYPAHGKQFRSGHVIDLNAPLTAWYQGEFSRALLRGTKRYKAAHLLLLEVHGQQPLLVPTLINRQPAPEQYSFLADLFAESIINDALEPSRNARRSHETKFVPSATLTELWISGVEEYIINSTAYKDQSAGLEIEENSYDVNAFAKKLKNMFGTMARLQLEGAEDFSLVSNLDGFTINVQHEIMDRFHVSPSKMSAFIYRLHQEFISYLREGGQIQGQWGKIELSEKGVTLKAEEPVKQLSSRKPAPVMELDVVIETDRNAVGND